MLEDGNQKNVSDAGKKSMTTDRTKDVNYDADEKISKKQMSHDKVGKKNTMKEKETIRKKETLQKKETLKTKETNKKKDTTGEKSSTVHDDVVIADDMLNLDDQPYEITSEDMENSETETSVETSAFLDQVLEDGNKIACMISAFVFLIGSYLNFWSIYSSELGVMNQGNLFGGYLLAGVIGKVCVILAIATIVLILFDQIRLNWYVAIGLIAFLAIQSLIILIFGRDDLGSGLKCIVVPGFGFIICFICVVVNLMFARKLYRKGI